MTVATVNVVLCIMGKCHDHTTGDEENCTFSILGKQEGHQKVVLYNTS
jgi:hypothetical protein